MEEKRTAEENRTPVRRLTVICPDDGSSPRLSGVLLRGLKEAGFSDGSGAVAWIRTADELEAWADVRRAERGRGRTPGGPDGSGAPEPDDARILFAVPLGESGVNLEYCRMLAYIRVTPDLFDGASAGLLVDGTDELYTKATATELVFSANQAGCRFIGRPLVEATGSLYNIHILARLAGVGLEEAYERAACDLIRRICAEKDGSIRLDRGGAFDRAPRAGSKKPRLLALHASNRATSNTLVLWGKVKQAVGDACEIEEIGLRNGKVEDCNGCAYTTCLHYGEKGECFYGGVIVEEVYPALERADGLILLCANYNDALSGNISASINRLTAMFRNQPFTGKKLFGVVVSGYSGGDIIARQLISALNMNKSFHLPPRFALLATANDPGSIPKIPGIDGTAGAFGQRIREELCGGDGR